MALDLGFEFRGLGLIDPARNSGTGNPKKACEVIRDCSAVVAEYMPVSLGRWICACMAGEPETLNSVHGSYR